MQSLEDLIRFNNENAAKEMPYFKQSIFEASAKRGDLKSKEYRDGVPCAGKLSRDEGIDAIMKKEKLDAIVAHSNSPTWLIDTVNGDCFSSYIGSSTPAAVAGYPAITLPAGFLKELPIGITFMGGAWQEAAIRMAFAYEQATKAATLAKVPTDVCLENVHRSRREQCEHRELIHRLQHHEHLCPAGEYRHVGR